MKQNRLGRVIQSFLPLAVLAAMPMMMGCSDEDLGSLQVFVQAESTISGGIQPGMGEEDMADGWKVTYDEFLVTVGHVRAGRTDTGAKLNDASSFVLDLKQVPAGGYVISEMKAASGSWYQFGFDMPVATAATEVIEPTTAMDKALLEQGGKSIHVAGAIENASGMSCPPGDSDPTKCVAAPKVTFAWGLPAGTSFDDCATADGTPGFAVPSGATAAVEITVHGDHWFFNNITAGVEIVQRYAQYIADCDLNHDGETTIEELKQVPAADVLPSSKYNLSGSFSGPIETAYDYVLAQARTIGDFQGYGECPTRKVLP
ncbi:MAG TPA: hypothetical protein PK156_17190 [Polyangium sp.]|nr:hypothetical protein [Polyangium sp.]